MIRVLAGVGRSIRIAAGMGRDAITREKLMFEEFISRIKEWAANESLVESIILVGSYVRGTQKSDSDIDVVIVTNNKQRYIQNPEIFNFYGEIEKINIEFYGECASIRVWYKNGLEVEYGMVTQTWVGIPLDVGTLRVLSDGYKILIDKKDIFLPVASIIPEYR